MLEEKMKILNKKEDLPLVLERNLRNSFLTELPRQLD